MCQVVGIPGSQLKIASLGRARLEKGYPSAIKLINQGVPKGLANAMAPFQRGGVDFIIDKDGRAMLADGTHCLHIRDESAGDFKTSNLVRLALPCLNSSRYGSRKGKCHTSQ
jgi:hypothetical protein